jgi:hypothetical protein
MADTMPAAGVGPSIKFRGKTYTLHPWTPELTALFEVWLQEQAWDAVERFKPGLSEEAYQRRLDTVAKLIGSRQFAFGSEACRLASTSLPGQKYSIYLQLRACDPEVTERLVEDIWAEKQQEIIAKLEAEKTPTDPPSAAST